MIPIGLCGYPAVLKIAEHQLPAMSDMAIGRVRALEAENLKLPQTPITTCHLIHAGLYARTITIPADTLLTGALIKIPTVLIFSGDATVTIGDDIQRLTGYHVIPASAGRKQAYLAHQDTTLTMLFATLAEDIYLCEQQFTDDFEKLFSRHGENIINITGD